ncbi:GDP-mannose pyrophosphatase NudK [Dyadobacter sp. LJ53]|uniref:GDP-mannose pyrophosphatase NudK n=1 Tax=Dyadobacter chenwenxiniae TaxID=2906456 RepID=UPI001F178640|nr:GDP-mannose pyrophosphatase NudK [Dyadobacter chenwenxiniae]MCF0049660.1 GDP-mannose pyrophosphatase NudK [Dyadobacter chenwenxiniae]
MKNDRVKVVADEVLSNNWYTLKKYTFDYQRADGQWERQSREAYDRGNGAVILLYNRAKQTVLLTRQFRIPTYVNGNEDGMLIEACAGLLDRDNAEDCIKRETEEETGYKIHAVEKIFEAYMSPGSVTEILYFFVAEYRDDMKVSNGGGSEQEQENIEVMELSFEKALAMVKTGEIRDAKTIMLLQYAQLNHLLAKNGQKESYQLSPAI